MKSLIDKALTVLTSSIPKLSVGFRLVVYYPPSKDYRLATVSSITNDKMKLLLDTGETVPYSITSSNIIGKGIPELHDSHLTEEGLNKYIKSFFIKPTTAMTSKKYIKLVTEPRPVKVEKRLNPIYDLLKECSQRLSISDHTIPLIGRNHEGGEIKAEISIEELISRLKKIPKIIIHEPSRGLSDYIISDVYTTSSITIIPPSRGRKFIVWFYPY